MSAFDSVTRQVAARVLESLPALVVRLGSLYREEVPEYRQIPDVVLEGDVLSVSRQVMEQFFEALARGRSPKLDPQLGLTALGRRRMEMGVSLDAMLHIFRINGRAVFNTVVDALQPGEEACLGTIGSQWLDYMDRGSSLAAIGYLEASHERVLHIEARRQALVEAVLAADEPGEAAALGAEFSLQLSRGYLPVCLPTSSGTDSVVSAAPSGSLTSRRGSALLVLVPSQTIEPAELLSQLQESTLSYGRYAELGAGLRAEVTRAELVLALATRRELCGCWGPTDFVVEQLLAASPRLAEDLRRETLAPLLESDRDGVLRRTMEVYFRSGSLAVSAEQLITHANTVTYRLKRIAQLTGLDPRIPADACQLMLVLAAS